MTGFNGAVLGLDADGVLLNYLDGFIGFLRGRGHSVACEAHEVTDWSMRSALPGWDDAKLYGEIEAFSVTDGFSRIRPIEGAVDAIRHIKDSLEGIRVVAITSAGSSEETARLRRANLELFPFDDVHVLPLGASKEEHLSRLPSGSVFVDDLYKHVQAAERAGVRGVLFRQPYNAADEHPHVITDWTQGRGLVMSLFGWQAEPAPLAAA